MINHSQRAWLGAIVLMLLPLQAAQAQVQDNSSRATLTVTGRAQDGFLDAPPQDIIPGTRVIFEITGEPFQPVVLAVGTAREPGVPLSTYGLLNLQNYTIVLNGLDLGGPGRFAWTGADGTLSLVAALSVDTPLDTEFTFQAAVGTDGPEGMILSAPERLRVRLARMAYLANEESSWTELYGNSTFGTSHVKFHEDLDDNESVSAYAWSPDGSMVAYIADQNYDTLNELFVSDGNSLNNRKVSGNLIVKGSVTDFQWSPDSSMLAYRADQDADEDYELYVAQADGSGSIKVSGSLAGFGDVEEFSWSPDSARIAYRADADSDGVFEMYAAWADGSGQVKISGTMPSGGSANSGQPVWSLDSTTVIYLASEFTAYKPEVIGAFASGAGSWALNSTTISAIIEFQLAPDGSRVAYQGGVNTGNVQEAFACNLDGSGNVQISAPLVLYGDVIEMQWSPDSSSIAYLADQEFDGYFELYVEDADAPTGAVKINGFLAPSGNVTDFGWSPDSSRLAYRADQYVNEVYELFTSMADGTSNTLINGPLITGGDVYDFLWSPATDLLRLAYRSDEDPDSGAELYCSDPEGLTQARLNDTASYLGSSNYRWDPSGVWCAFQDQGNNLMVNDRTGKEQHQLDIPGGNWIMSFAWSPIE